MSYFEWNDKLEKLLIHISDSCQCYKSIHEASFRKYKKIAMGFQIPIIVLSTMNGMFSFSQQKIFIGTNYSDVIIGAISSVVGVLGTLNSYFGFPQLAESHFNSYVAFSKLHRSILSQLNLERKNRKPAEDFVKSVIQEYDRLNETAKLPSQEIMEAYVKQFGEIKHLKIPTDGILDFVRHTEIFSDTSSHSSENGSISPKNEIDLKIEKNSE